MSSKIAAPVISARELTKIKKLGQGQFGEVWQGKCRGADVAIKYLKHFDSSMKEEFVAEVEIMAQVVHPHIVLLLGASTDEKPWAMVTELMNKGDLHYILHESADKDNLSLNRKFQFAIDISSGMAWLTGKEVKILHRDLKPGNVLVDQNWTCKICDFGLSFLESKGMVKGDAVGGGSPLWMSPEALLDELPLTEKNDVYAFGLVFWEILTQDALFQQYTDIDLFTDDIANKGIRPPTEKIEHPDILALVQECWDKNQEVRPSFKELITRIKKLRVSVNLPLSMCPQAGKLWEKGQWLGAMSVPLGDFVTLLYNQCNCSLDKTVYLKCLDMLFFQGSSAPKEVTLEHFSHLLKWFGPLNAQSELNILEVIRMTCEQEWFFGSITRDDAEGKLKPYQDDYGTYLVRLNAGSGSAIEAYPYTISRVVESSGGSEWGVVHTRIQPSKKTGGFFCSVVNQSGGKQQLKGPSLRDLVADCQQKKIKECSIACPGSPFESIFAKAPAVPFSGYQLPSDSEEEDDEEEEVATESSVKKSGRKKKSSSPSSKKKKDKK